MRFNILKTCTLTFMAVFLLLFSCSNNNNDQAIKSDNAFIEENKNEISPIANEDWFKNDIYLLSNPLNMSYLLVRGDGKVILSTYDPEIEHIGKIEDVSKTTNYVYKNFTGENIIRTNISNTDEEYIDVTPTQRCVAYDKYGNEIGLEANAYSISYSSKNKIIYRLSSEDNSSAYFAFDVNTKEITKLDYEEISIMNGHFLLGTSPWSDNENEVVLVLDDNLNEVKKIEGYSLSGVTRNNNNEFATLRKRNKEGKDPKYNFLSSNFEVIFEDDLDEIIWNGNFSVITLRRGNKVFDYDFSNHSVVGAERDYIPESNDSYERKINEAKYEPMANAIKDENADKYSYVYSFIYNGKVLYLAHKTSNVGMFDHDSIDVYSEDGKRIAEFEDLSNYYYEDGYLFVNHDTIYNINLQVVKTLKEKRNIERSTKFNKVFYNDSVGLDYGSAKPFTLYDSNFEPIIENLECIEMNTYDDYILIVDSEGTKFLDKDLNVVKTIDRKMDIKSWYDNESGFKAFEDLDTGRMGIIDKDYNIVVDKLKYAGALEDKYFTYQNGFYYGLMDYKGIPILKYSIFDTMKEDANYNDFKGKYVVEYDDYE